MKATGRVKRQIEPPKIPQNCRQMKAEEKSNERIIERRKIEIYSEIKNIDEISDDEMDEKPTINFPKVFPYGEKDNDTIFIRPIYNQKQFQKFKAEENLKKEIEFNKQNKVINPNLIESSQSSYNINNRIVHNLPKNIKVPENRNFVIDEPIKNNEPVIPKVVQVQSGFMTSDFL